MLWDYKQFLVDKEIKLYQQFILNYEPKEEDLLSQKEHKFEFTPNFCIITEKEHLFLKESLETQTYKNFTLISLDDGTKVDCDYYILCNSFLSFAPNFLFKIVSELNNNRECDFFYFDEDKIDYKQNRREPFFKPDFSPDTLRSCNYIGNAICISKKLFAEIDIFDSIKDNEDVQKAKINPILHYLRFGWKEGRNPSEQFDNKAYLNQRPDVKVAGICPLVHYLKFGKNKNE